MTDIDTVVDLMWQRRLADTRLIRQMIAIRDRYSGDMVIPMPDVKNNPVMRPPTPNLIAEAIDDQAARANAMQARITSPPKDFNSKQSVEQAENKRRALYGRWHTSQLEIKLYRFYRHLIGYGTAAMVTMFDEEAGHAKVELRDPLLAYPELRAPDDIREPKNCGFIFPRSVNWIKTHFPDAPPPFFKMAEGQNWDTLWDTVEWVDEDEIILGIMGPRLPAYGSQEARTGTYAAFELGRWPNKANCVPVVCPRRVTLDRIQGQLSALIETMDLFGRISALEIIAMERAIFPDMVIISKTGGPPQLYSGDWHDGRSGKVNLLSDSEAVVLASGPGPATATVTKNLELGLRSSGGAIGANEAAGMRTGAGVNALSGFAVDPKMQENQAIVARTLSTINTHIQETEKGWAPKAKMFVIPGLRTDMTAVQYVPEIDFAFTPTVVDYPYAGMDVASLSVATAQLEGTKLASRKSLRKIHPLIDDGDDEELLVAREAVEDATLAGFQSALEQGQYGPGSAAIGAHVLTLLDGGKTVAESITEALAVLQQQAPAPGQPGAPVPGQPPGPNGEPGAPAQPGDASQLSPQQQAMLAAVGAKPGAEASVPPPDAGLVNQQKLTRAINARISPGAV